MTDAGVAEALDAAGRDVVEHVGWFKEDADKPFEPPKVTAHYSSLTLHRKCPQAWLYRYGFKIQTLPDETPAPRRDFGSWWSALRAADVYERGRAIGSLLPIARPFSSVNDGPRFDPATVTRKDVLAALQVWWRARPTEYKDAWIAELGKPAVEHFIYTFQAWRERWSEHIKTERPLGAEVFWKRQLPRPTSDERWEGDTSGLPEMWLLGYIDEIYEDTERGLVVARDHKSGGNLGLNLVIDDMMDSQLQLYAWGVTPMLANHGLAKIRAVAYDRTKSIAPKPPSLTTAGKLGTYKGEPSINSSDVRTYIEWANGPDGEGLPWRGAAFPRNAAEKVDLSLPTRYKPGGVYKPEDDIIERLSTRTAQAQWFKRKLIPLNRNIVEAHLRSAVDTATDIWRTEQRAARSGEAARNVSKGNCSWCDFQQLCLGQMIGGPAGTYDLAEFRLRSSSGEVLAEGKVQ